MRGCITSIRMAEANPFENDSTQNPDAKPGERKIRAGRLRSPLRLVSAISLVLALVIAVAIVAIDYGHFFGAGLPSWRPRPAFALILAGLSYSCLQITLPRTRREFLLGIAVAGAFILWGAEQFVPDERLVTLIDDAVVFLFVMDLSIVILGGLKEKRK